jgi:hypothetical protein
MKTYKLFLPILFLALSGSCIHSERNSMEDKLRGMWKLDKFEAYDSISHKWGDDFTRIGYSGYILYDGLGHMAVHLLPKGYNDFDSGKKLDSISKDELREIAKIYESNYVYFADYKIEGGKVYHTKLSATNPKDKGSIAIREFEFIGDTLILKPKEKINGLRLRLKWVKM